ncbi:MAG: Sec-independent protein translocase protein TatB [Pseudomonadota bacterium]
MFDVSFSELMVIAVVALLVIGPEKLPKVARTIGALTGRVQRYVGQVKEEVNRELRFEELQKLQQEIQQSVQAAQSSVQQQVATIENAISQDDGISNVEPEVATKPIRKPRIAKSGVPASKKVASAKASSKKVGM